MVSKAKAALITTATVLVVIFALRKIGATRSIVDQALNG